MKDVMGTVVGVGYGMWTQQKTWAKDGWRVLPHFDIWVEVKHLASDGLSFTVEHYYRARTSRRFGSCEAAKTCLLCSMRHENIVMTVRVDAVIACSAHNVVSRYAFVRSLVQSGGIEYNPAPLPIPVRAIVPTQMQAGSVAKTAAYGSTGESVRTCSQ